MFNLNEVSAVLLLRVMMTKLYWRRTMWKAALAGATALAIAGTSIVYAQQRSRVPDAGARWQLSQDDIAAFADARIAALKAGLRLTPDQEKNWASFESAIRDFAKARAERANAANAGRNEAGQNEQAPNDPVERLRRQADALSSAGARLKRLVDAEEPLYKSLDESQKRRFHALAVLGPRNARVAGFHQRGDRNARGGHREWGRTDGPGPRGPGGPGRRDDTQGRSEQNL
jgi:hypothetical protein